MQARGRFRDCVVSVHYHKNEKILSLSRQLVLAMNSPPYLPPDVMASVFQAFEDEHGGLEIFDKAGTAEQVSSRQEYQAFFRSTALVCKDWYRPTLSHGRTVHIPDCEAADLISRSCEDGLHLNVKHLYLGYNTIGTASFIAVQSW